MNLVFIGGGILLILLGTGLGYYLAVLRMRRASGGKTPAELQKELDDYRNEVSEHFAESAQLLGKMTEQYRDVYSHIAKGAHKLGAGDELPPQVEQLRARLITDGSTEASGDPGDDEPETDTTRDPGERDEQTATGEATDNEDRESGPAEQSPEKPESRGHISSAKPTNPE